MANGFKSLLCKESLLIPLFLYCLVKLLLPTNGIKFLPWKIFISVLHIFLTILLMPILFLILTLCAVYFELVQLLAKFVFGKDFHEALDGADVIWGHDPPETPSIPHALFLLENVPGTPERVMEVLQNQESQLRVLKNHPRLQCTLKRFMGHMYFVRTKLDMSKIITYFDEYNTTEEFKQLINEITPHSLPCNNEALWEIKVGRTPIALVNGRLQYPLLMRAHHSMTDGVTWIAFFLTTFVEDGFNNMQVAFGKFAEYFKRPPESTKQSISFWDRCKRVLDSNIYFHYNFLDPYEKPNVLHRKLSGKKFVCFSAEKEGDQILQKIRATKRTLKVAFNDVVLAAISASFTEYFKKYDQNGVKEIFSLNPYFLKVAEMDKIVTLNNQGVPITQMGNKFSLGFITLPIDKDNLKRSNFENLIRTLHETTNSAKSGMDFAFVYWLFNVVGTIVPKVVVSRLTKLFDATCIITNVPGINHQIKFINGYNIESSFIWANNYQKMGVTLSLHTYVNTFYIALHVDAALVEDVADVQRLSDNIIRYINVFYDELTSNCQ